MPAGGGQRRMKLPRHSFAQTSIHLLSIHAFFWQRKSLVGSNGGSSVFTMHLLAVPLKMIIGRKKLPAALHVRAEVALCMSFVDWRTLTVFVPLFCRVYEQWYENQSGVWSISVRTGKQRTSCQEKCQRLPGNNGWCSGCLIGLHTVNEYKFLQPKFCHHEFGIEWYSSEFGANELLCLPHDMHDGDGHPLLVFLEQPSMELVLHSFELANRTSSQAQALALNFCFLPELNLLAVGATGGVH